MVWRDNTELKYLKIMVTADAFHSSNLDYISTRLKSMVEIALSTSQQEVKKRQAKCCLWNVAFAIAETWTL